MISNFLKTFSIFDFLLVYRVNIRIFQKFIKFKIICEINNKKQDPM